MIRRGRQTSEFLVTALTAIGLLASAIAGVVPPKWAGILGTVAAAAYTISRGLAKLNDPSANRNGRPPTW